MAGARAFYDQRPTPTTATTKPSAPWATASWASCTAAYATTPHTTSAKAWAHRSAIAA